MVDDPKDVPTAENAGSSAVCILFARVLTHGQLATMVVGSKEDGLSQPDETRPVCNRCKKRGLSCDGPKDSTWISVYDQNPAAGSVSHTIPEELAFVAFEDDLIVAYTRKNLLKGGCVELACDIVRSAGLGNDLLEPGLDLLRNAILSLSASFFGTQLHQTAILNRGYRCYGQVLTQLNNHLAQPHLQTTDETIMTAIACMLLEIFAPTGPDKFLEHVRGVEAIITARGPPSSPNGSRAEVLSGVRILCVVGALVQRRMTIWATPEWRSIPSAQTDEGLLVRHEVLSVMADLTVLAKERPIVSPAAAHEGRLRALAFAQICSNNLTALYHRWNRHNAGLQIKQTPPGADPVITNYASAITYMLYNTAFIFTQRILHLLNPSEENQSLKVAAALQIVRCLEVTANEKDISGESNTITFVATRTAWMTLGAHHASERQRLSNALKSGVDGVSVKAIQQKANAKPPKLFAVPPGQTLVHCPRQLETD